MPTDSLIAVFIFAFAASFGAVISPGPVSAAIITEAPRRGWIAGALIACGHTSLELVMVLLIAGGLSTSLAAPAAYRMIALAGGGFLLFIGGGYLWGVTRNRIRLPDPDHAAARRPLLGLLSLGLGTTLANPFWYAWWLTVAAGYLAEAQALGPASVAAFYLGHILADFIWDTGLAAATAAGSNRWMTPRRYQALILASGAFMLYLGLSFIRVGLDRSI
jgi:threonine/homoserine/homoserine lactone efflux protein